MLFFLNMHFFRLLKHENQTLLDQVRVLTDENGRLFKLLSEKDFEINHLKKKREEERLALAGIVAKYLCTFQISNMVLPCSF